MRALISLGIKGRAIVTFLRGQTAVGTKVFDAEAEAKDYLKKQGYRETAMKERQTRIEEDNLPILRSSWTDAPDLRERS